MPVEWVDEEFGGFLVLPSIGHAKVWNCTGYGWVALWRDRYLLDEQGEWHRFPTRDAAKLAAEAEARRALWGGLKALDAPNIKRAIAAWFGEEGEFDTADYEADMRRAFEAGMELDNG